MDGLFCVSRWSLELISDTPIYKSKEVQQSKVSRYFQVKFSSVLCMHNYFDNLPCAYKKICQITNDGHTKAQSLILCAQIQIQIPIPNKHAPQNFGPICLPLSLGIRCPCAKCSASQLCTYVRLGLPAKICVCIVHIKITRCSALKLHTAKVLEQA